MCIRIRSFADILSRCQFRWPCFELKTFFCGINVQTFKGRRQGFESGGQSLRAERAEFRIVSYRIGIMDSGGGLYVHLVAARS